MAKVGLRKIIQSILHSELSDFQSYDVESDFIWPNEVPIYKKSGEITFFIVFSPHAQDPKRFTVDVGWSRLGRFPRIDGRPCFNDPDPAHSEFSESEYFTRLGILKSGIDRWWLMASAIGATDVVRGVMQEIRETALPYFDLLLEFHPS